MLTTTDTALVEQARHGSTEARAALYTRHARAAWRTAYLITGSAALAEEVSQDSFLKAFAGLEGFDQSRPFAPWFFRIVTNQALSVLRRERWTVTGVVPDVAGAVPDWLETDGSPLRQALAALRPEQRAVVALRYWLDLGPAEIGEVLGIPTGTVQSRLARALETLRETVEEES
jgi:RNA polymerase sigma-70 factor (ECF subfamily)